MNGVHQCPDPTRHPNCVEDVLFPKIIHNRHGLRTMDYRIGTYADIRAALFRRLDESTVLAGWTHRGSDDPGIALIEGAAVVGDILTFYQQLYANETKLRTADWRDTVGELVRLTGYRLASGLGGKATIAFEVGKAVKIPAGFAVRAQLEGIDAPVMLETVNAVDARPGLSEFNMYRPLQESRITRGVSELRLVGNTDDLAEGDRIFLAHKRIDGRLMRPEVLVVEEIRTVHGETVVKVSGSRQSAQPQDKLTVYRIARTFRHFGHNAPPTKTVMKGNATTQEPVKFERSLIDTSPIPDPDLEKDEFPLDAEVDDLSPGSQIICHEEKGAESFTVVRTAKSVRNDSYTWGALTGPTTVVTVDQPLRLLADDDGDTSRSKGTGETESIQANGSGKPDIRKLQFHEIVGTALVAYRAPTDDAALIKGRKLYFFGPAADAAAMVGRRLLSDPSDDTANVFTVTKVSPATSPVTDLPHLHEIELDREVTYSAFPNEPDQDENQVIFHGNVVDADQGETRDEVVLGNGDARQRFQTFKLPKSPLTYHYATAETPPELAEVSIWVDGRAWKQVASLYGQTGDADVYVVRQDETGASYVQFGDGELLGSRLPSGIDNVTAIYRTGTGAHGALKDGTTVQAVERLDGVAGVSLPGVATGGAQPEAPESAREAAPGRTQSLGRLVGLSDFEAEALSISGVVKASAAWKAVAGVPGIVVTVLMEAGRDDEYAAVRASLESAERNRGPDRHAVTVQQGFFAYVYLNVVVGIVAGRKPTDVLAATRTALGEATRQDESGRGLFGLTSRRFGRAVHATSIAGIIQQVPGVSWCRIDAIANIGRDLDGTTVATKIASAGRAFAVCGPDEVLRLEERAANDLIRLTSSGGGNASG